ncbi:HAD family hydrolase [Rufibacter sediminis]|uniref:HAD family hydrolase n=1 Tax=Rufibacter sediminis TaxID=2762756 RepID=A0ABR6VX02_9BACT|nr:HAD family hydrolase [Rufibacter sediminis]MBC3541663.1 HAD family hydrolase [Rufibacter sediminis]
MILSFDLDDTLIPGRNRFPTEKQNLFQKALGLEKVRRGTVQLMKRLKAEGHQVYVYTTSFRSASYIRCLFLSYGIWLDGIINQKRHDRTCKAEGRKCSKYPPAFGIDLHVDDSTGVEMEGQRYGFKTIIIAEEEEAWVERVLRILHP